MQPTADIVKSANVAAMLAARKQAFDSLATIADEARCLERIGVPDGAIKYDAGRHDYWMSQFNAPDKAGQGCTDSIRAEIDARFWRALMSDTGMWSYMNASRRDDWDKMTCAPNPDTLPLFTPENVAATFVKLFEDRDQMIVDGVCDCFRSLSWDYKSNKPVKFGKRIIVEYITSWHGPRSRQVDDLERYMHIVDGQPEPNPTEKFSSQMRSHYRQATEIETPYMRIKIFKNGNGHVHFKRPDIVEQMNRMLASRFPAALPAARN